MYVQYRTGLEKSEPFTRIVFQSARRQFGPATMLPSAVKRRRIICLKPITRIQSWSRDTQTMSSRSLHQTEQDRLRDDETSLSSASICLFEVWLATNLSRIAQSRSLITLARPDYTIALSYRASAISPQLTKRCRHSRRRCPSPRVPKAHMSVLFHSRYPCVIALHVRPSPVFG